MCEACAPFGDSKRWSRSVEKCRHRVGSPVGESGEELLGPGCYCRRDPILWGKLCLLRVLPGGRLRDLGGRWVRLLCLLCLDFPAVRAVRRSASTPPVLVSRTTSLSPRGTLFPAACAESITGLLSANTHALASALYYPHTSQLRSTRYILPHAVRHLPCPSSSRARALLKYRPYNFLLEDPAKPNLFSS